ncbi:MAG: hypothetical protein ACREUT_03070 [Steroidobacteraceae bacterium]
MRWAVPLALLGLAAGGSLLADPPDGGAVIARCAREADTSLRGLDALTHRCPGIESAVRGLGLDPLLPANWQKTASARALADLAGLADRYAGPVPHVSLDSARLKVIAGSLEPPAAPPSLWERIVAWLRDWLEPKNQEASSWLRFLPYWHVSPRLARVILEAFAALIVIGVTALTVRELTASGLIGDGRRRRAPRRTSPLARPTGEAPVDRDALDDAALHERPALLLRLLVRALRRSHRLGPHRYLTCREIIAKARFDSPRQRVQFEAIALLAERAVYQAPALAPAAIPEEMLVSARALHAEFLAPPRSEPLPS